MTGLENYTEFELLKEINDIKSKHDSMKKNITDLLNQIDEIEKDINNKVVKLNELEENYVILLEEFNKR